MGIKLDDLIFSKKKPTKKGAIIKNLIIIAIILIVIAVAIITTLTKLGSALNDETWKDIKSTLSKTYDESLVVTFVVSGLDEQNLKNKLTSNFSSISDLYVDGKLNTNALFGSARIVNQTEFDKKDLTLISKAYLQYVVGKEVDNDVFDLFEITNVELSTQSNTTNLRLCVKIDTGKLINSNILKLGFLSTDGMPDYVFLTGLYAIDNTKPLNNCLKSYNIVTNNLSEEDNQKVLSYFLKVDPQTDDYRTYQKAPALYFLDALASVFENWQASVSFVGQGLLLNAK